MSMINEGNLEEFIFDYLEGNLSPGQAAELEAFLKAHPEHAADMEAWNATYLTAPQEVPVYAGAQSLVQPAGSWLGGMGVLGWGTLGVVLVTAAILLFRSESPERKVPAITKEVPTMEPAVIDSFMPKDTLAAIDTTPHSDTLMLWASSWGQVDFDFSMFPFPSYNSTNQGYPDYGDPFPDSYRFDFSGLYSPVPDSFPLPDTVPTVVADTLVVPPDTAMAADTIPTLALQEKDFSTQRNTKRGKTRKKKNRKKDNRVKKPVRVVPLKSDAF